MAEFDGMRVTVLGARGSVPACGRQFTGFGGSTSCYMVQAGEQTVFLDAGSGLVSAPVDFSVPPVILLSHLHLDHILGLGMYPRLSQKGKRTDIYVPAAPGEDPQALLNGVYEPPYWPLTLKNYAGDVHISPLQAHLEAGGIAIDTLEGYHPGGCKVFRLRYNGKTLVYATDQEPDEDGFAKLAAFAKDADLLLFDGQYSEEEYESRRGFGHSTAQKGIALMQQCGAKKLLLIHHDPHSTDAELTARETALGRADVRYAREGETIVL